MFAYHLEKHLHGNVVRAIVHNVTPKGSYVEDIAEVPEDQVQVLSNWLDINYPDINAVYLGGTIEDRAREGVTLVGAYAVLVPDACDAFCIAEAEMLIIH